MQRQKRKVVLIGSPNVGKSLLFNHLTGNYVSVSNYPGTTVDVARGTCRIGNQLFEIVDTPGIYSLLPLTEEEWVTREVLRDEAPDVLIHVVDAKNLRRMLHLTLQLMDTGLPLILDLNMIDEIHTYGLKINTKLLSELLQIPVVATAATTGTGLEELRHILALAPCRPPSGFVYSPDIEQAIADLAGLLNNTNGLSPRLAALLLLQEDRAMLAALSQEPAREQIVSLCRAVAARYNDRLSLVLAQQRQRFIDELLAKVIRHIFKSRSDRWLELCGRWTRQPWPGIPILALVLYFGLYKFVGRFGAGFLVDYIDGRIFGTIINPFVHKLVQTYISIEWLRSLLVGDYGLYSLGVRYAVAIILPIVGTFFLMFALLEDSGYLPRLAMLVDRLFKHLGLNGRAVIPLALGLGCGTMAVVVTRTLETRRERLLATFLLALTIPCSAQLGLVLALLSHNGKILAIWLLYILSLFVMVGWLSAKVLPGNHSPFYMELPPLRCPQLTNVLNKALTRMVSYFTEILPIFVLTSAFLWLGDYTGLLASLTEKLKPICMTLGLPSDMAAILLLGFFRRDYGAAGLYDLAAGGHLSDHQLLVAAVTLTLFVPCIAQLAVIIKERGVFSCILMLLLIALISFFSGWCMHLFLSL